MNEFKFQLSSALLVVILGLGVFWAFTHLEKGVPTQEDRVIVMNDEDVSFEDENIPLAPDEIIVEPTKPAEEVKPEPTESTKTLIAEEKELRDALERLITDNIYMKNGSRGTRVGTVQKFLNYYFETNKTIDNDYGPGTITDVKKFQQQEGIDADGFAGPGTYKKMIEIIEK